MADASKVLTASASIEFGREERGNSLPYTPIKLVMEMDDRKHADQTTKGTMRVRMYPAVPYKDPYNFVEVLSDGQVIRHIASIIGTPLPSVDVYSRYLISSIEHCGYFLQVTQGTLKLTKEVRVKQVAGTLLLNGGREFDLPYPLAIKPKPDLGFAPTLAQSIELIRVGSYYDGAGNEITNAVIFQFDGDTQKILASHHVFGELAYSFRSEYVICEYVPATYHYEGAYYIPNDSDYGSIVAYPPTTAQDGVKEGIVVFQVQMPPAIGAEFELYRIESEAIVNEKGVWEKPPNFPKAGRYPDIKDKILDTASSYMAVSRVHEVATVSMLDRTVDNTAEGSVTIKPLPVDFTAAEKRAAKRVGMTGDSEADSYMKNVKSFPKTFMRTTGYHVPIAIPYDKFPPKPYEEKVWLKQEVQVGDNKVNKQELKHEVWRKYKIKLVVKPGSVPSPAGVTIQKGDKIDPNTGLVDNSYDYQAAYINALFRRMWEAVDWNVIKNQIKTRYDPDVYEVTFEPNFPSTGAS